MTICTEVAAIKALGGSQLIYEACRRYQLFPAVPNKLCSIPQYLARDFCPIFLDSQQGFELARLWSYPGVSCSRFTQTWEQISKPSTTLPPRKQDFADSASCFQIIAKSNNLLKFEGTEPVSSQLENCWMLIRRPKAIWPELHQTWHLN